MSAIREALIEHSLDFPDGADRCGTCGMRMDSPHALGCRVPAALAELEAMERERRDLVTLVRIGFLVTDNGERPSVSTVRHEGLRALLVRILTAEDTAAEWAEMQERPEGTTPTNFDDSDPRGGMCVCGVTFINKDGKTFPAVNPDCPVHGHQAEREHD